MNDIISLDGIFENGYGFIAKQVMQDREIPIGAKGLYSYICSFSGKGQDAFPSRSKITYDLNISNDTLGKYLRLLTEHGYLTVIQKKEADGKFAHNVYKINVIKKPCPKISDTEKTVYDKTVSGKLDTNNNNINNNNINNKVSKKESKIIDLAKTSSIKDRQKEKTYEDIIKENIDDDGLANSFLEFIKMRKMIKAPLTNNALELAIKKVNKLAPGNRKNQKAIVDQSIMNSWKGLFPLKNDEFDDKSTTNRNYQEEAYSEEELEKLYRSGYLRRNAYDGLEDN